MTTPTFQRNISLHWLKVPGTLEEHIASIRECAHAGLDRAIDLVLQDARHEGAADLSALEGTLVIVLKERRGDGE